MLGLGYSELLLVVTAAAVVLGAPRRCIFGGAPCRPTRAVATPSRGPRILGWRFTALISIHSNPKKNNARPQGRAPCRTRRWFGHRPGSRVRRPPSGQGVRGGGSVRSGPSAFEAWVCDGVAAATPRRPPRRPPRPLTPNPRSHHFPQLHGDLRETARQLQQIRSELRSGVSLLPARVGAAVPSATRSDAALPSALPPAARHLRASANSPLPGELPFSASSLGRVPPRGPGATGSDIAADALEEETVSRLTSQFLAQGDRGEDRGGDGGGGKAGAGE